MCVYILIYIYMYILGHIASKEQSDWGLWAVTVRGDETLLEALDAHLIIPISSLDR